MVSGCTAFRRVAVLCAMALSGLLTTCLVQVCIAADQPIDGTDAIVDVSAEAAAGQRLRALQDRLSKIVRRFSPPKEGAYPGYHGRETLTRATVGEMVCLSRLHRDVLEMKWSPDGRQLALVGWEQPVEIVDAITLAHARTIGADRQIIHFAFSSNPNFVAYCENTTTAEIVDLRNDVTVELDAVNQQPGMQFSPDGELLATGGYGDTVRLWSVADGELIRTFLMGKSKGGLTPVFSPDGTILAVGNRNSTTHLFSVQSGERLRILEKSSSQGLAFDPTGTVLAVGYVDGSFALWDVATGELTHEQRIDAVEVYRVAWSPDGELLATCGLHSEISIWDGFNLAKLHRLPAPEWVIGLTFSPDGRRLLTSGGEQRRNGHRELTVWGLPPVEQP